MSNPARRLEPGRLSGIGVRQLDVGGRRIERGRRTKVHPRPSTLRDLFELTKPTITAMSVLMAAGAMLLASPGLDLVQAALALVGTGLAVGSANALNMVWERNGDRLMKRTRRRPLPDGRLSPISALLFGVALGSLGIVVLAVWVNGLTALLGAVALLSYVFVYTPLKRRSPLALIIGAVPGAMPPLMGWTAVTGALEAPGLVLFSILLLWQLPHFLAIAIYCERDYAGAGIQAVSVVRGARVAKLQALAYSTALVPVSLLLIPLGVAGWAYLLGAASLGAWFWWIAVQGLSGRSGTQWARRLFRASLVYLPVLMLVLAVDTVLGI